MCQENLSQSVPKDELQDDPRQDILARALNVPEYPGRVRAAGLGVCQKRYFSGKKRRRKNPTVEEMDDLKAQLQQMKTMMCEMSKKLNDKEAMDKQQSDLVVASVKDSASYHIPKVLIFLISIAVLLNCALKFSLFMFDLGNISMRFKVVNPNTSRGWEGASI